jgi:hypothetical protein
MMVASWVVLWDRRQPSGPGTCLRRTYVHRQKRESAWLWNSGVLGHQSMIETIMKETHLETYLRRRQSGLEIQQVMFFVQYHRIRDAHIE